MSITLCLPSRANPEKLLAVIERTDRNVARPDQVTISVALDDDDVMAVQAPTTRCKLIWSVAPREDSLGEKYNRCAANAPAGLYVMGADDNIFTTEGWDERINDAYKIFPDELGFVYFGRLDGTLPTNMAIPHCIVETQGFLFPPFFPFWFHDTWIDEIGHMTSRILWAPVAVEEIGGRGNTRGLRDLPFWTGVFLELAPARARYAALLSEKYNPDWLAYQLAQRSDHMKIYFWSRMERWRNPATAIQYERRKSYDAEPSERYLRIKAKAQAMLEELRKPAEVAA